MQAILRALGQKSAAESFLGPAHCNRYIRYQNTSHEKLGQDEDGDIVRGRLIFACLFSCEPSLFEHSLVCLLP